MSSCHSSKTNCETTATSEVSSDKKKEGGCDVIRYMEKLADQAWEELFKEKVKKHYEVVAGSKMDRNAKIVAEQAILNWKHKMESKDSKREYEQKLFTSLKSE